MVSPVVLAIAVILWGFFLWSRRDLYKLSWEMGGPIGLPFLGSILEFRRVADFMDTMQAKIWSKYKSPCAIWGGTGLHILVRDPETATAVLTSSDFLDKHMMYKPFEIILGENSIISSRAEVWKLHRKAVDPALTYQNVKRLISPFNNAIETFMSEVLSLKVGKGEVDIKEDLVRLFGDLTVENTVGQNLDLIHSRPGEVTFLDNIMRVEKLCVERALKLYLHNDFIFTFTKAYYEIVERREKIYKVMRELFQKHPDPKAKVRYTDGQFSILSYLKKLQGTQTFSEQDIVNDMATLMTASFETTAFSVFLILFYLAQYPDYQERVFEELISIYPEKRPQIGVDTLGDLVYTEMFINEVLRMHPPIPMIGRQTSKDTRLSTGQFMPKGTQVLIDFIHLHRNENVWGPGANEFNPDNFLPQNLEQLPPNAFMPFSVGPRNCAGIRYAKVILKVVTAKLARTYKFSSSWKIDDVVLIPGIVMEIENNPLITIEERPK